MRLLAILLLTSCTNTFQTQGDAVGYCMVLGEVPVRVEGWWVALAGSARLHNSCTANYSAIPNSSP